MVNINTNRRILTTGLILRVTEEQRLKILRILIMLLSLLQLLETILVKLHMSIQML
jgi:hypothetical protein